MVSMKDLMKEASDNDELQDVMRKIKATVHKENGRTVGLKVTNLQNHEVFRKLGVREGDVFTTVNGLKLDSLPKAYELARKFENSRSLRIGIIRNNRPHFIINLKRCVVFSFIIPV